MNYHKSATFHTTLKIKFRNFAKGFVKKNLTLSKLLTHSKSKIIFNFSYKDMIPYDLKSFLVYEFTCMVVVLTTLGKLFVILKLGLRNISKRKDGKSHILSIYTPTQHALSSIVFFLLKQLIKLNLNSTYKLNKIYILNLNAQQNYLACTLSLLLMSPLCSFLPLSF